MAELKQGQSDSDTVSIRLPDIGKEITNVDSYTLSTDFLTPSDKFVFKVSVKDDVILANELLIPGTKIQVIINEKIQMTAFIDKCRTSSSRSGGTVVNIDCRDILGRVVSSTTDFEDDYTTKTTVLDILNKNLPIYGIDKIYNDDLANVNAITGFEPGKAKYISDVKKEKPVIGYEKNKDGSFKLDSKNQKIKVYGPEKTIVTQKSINKPGLKDLTLDHLKAKPGEGEYGFIDRILKRHGLIMRAAADGSGVVVDKPNFEGPSIFSIIRKQGDLDSLNNVESMNIDVDFAQQPSLIIGIGFGGGKKARKSQFKAIMVNELVGCDQDGNILPEVQQIIQKHPGFKTLPIRKNLVPTRNKFAKKLVPCFVFFKDDDSKTQDQLEQVVRRKMAEFQQKALIVTCVVEGHTQNGHPWCVNTITDVDDDVLNVHERMWVLNRRFDKSRSGGTKTSLTLIRPGMLLIGE